MYRIGLDCVHSVIGKVEQFLTEPTATSKPEFKTACGGKLKDPTNYPSAIYRGQRIYFCTTACLSAFEREPEPFMTGEVEHPIRKTE